MLSINTYAQCNALQDDQESQEQQGPRPQGCMQMPRVPPPRRERDFGPRFGWAAIESQCPRRARARAPHASGN